MPITKSRICFVGFPILAVVLAVVALLMWAREPEPVYQGKPAKYWIRSLYENEPFPWNSNRLDAVPVLLRAVEQRENVFNSAAQKIRPVLPGWIKSRWHPIDAAEVHKQAAYLLGQTGSFEFNIKMLKSHPDPDVRICVGQPLGLDRENEKATEALAEAILHDKDPHVRLNLLFDGFVAHEPARVAATLFQSLCDSNVTVRKNVALVMNEQFDSPERLETITGFYKNHPQEREVSIQHLLKAFKDKTPGVHEAAAKWLWRIDGHKPEYSTP